MEPWYFISPSLILLLYKVEIILPHCLNAWRCLPLTSVYLSYFYCLALGDDSVCLSLEGFTTSAWFYHCIASFYWVIFHFILFYCMFHFSLLTFTFKWGIRNSSSKETVMRADAAPAGDWQAFIPLLSSARFFSVSPKWARILYHILAEILHRSLQV